VVDNEFGDILGDEAAGIEPEAEGRSLTQESP
jgi:hypothetical protein